MPSGAAVLQADWFDPELNPKLVREGMKNYLTTYWLKSWYFIGLLLEAYPVDLCLAGFTRWVHAELP